jgi:hypothetical protein
MPHEGGKCLVFKVPRQCWLVLLVERGWQEGKAFGSEEGKTLGSEDGEVLGSEEGKVSGSEKGKVLEVKNVKL